MTFGLRVLLPEHREGDSIEQLLQWDNIDFLLTQKDLDYYDGCFLVPEMSGNPDQVHLLGELKPEFFQQDKLYSPLL
ncbi:hypothetical protein [Nostoc sp. PA-18-2419]|uniref:hypothetical protein n=1 Tax=Nostoc sp. PA-18-2419 TaxID=2575443 RepID=UPI001109187D|nr:hypothetical protein [Nostoc sp. PA-18-2419]